MQDHEKRTAALTSGASAIFSALFGLLIRCAGICLLTAASLLKCTLGRGKYLELQNIDRLIMRCTTARSICWQVDRLVWKDLFPSILSPGFCEPAPLRGCDSGSSLCFHTSLGIRTCFLDYGLAVKQHLENTVCQPEIAPARSNL